MHSEASMIFVFHGIVLATLAGLINRYHIRLAPAVYPVTVQEISGFSSHQISAKIICSSRRDSHRNHPDLLPRDACGGQSIR